MFAVRRWWDRYAIKVGLISLAVGSAWFVRQTQGVVIYETYQWLTRPLQPGLTQEQRMETAYILELQQRVVELERQNQELQRLVDNNTDSADPGIMAAMIGRSADHWWQQIIIGKGSRDGLEPGYVVMGLGGLVGRVTEVTPNTSRVLLISDPTSRVGAKISRSRAMGYIRGQSNNRVVMQFFEKLPDVKPGDVVVTSSYSRLFPEGIPIGQIESLNLTNGPAPEAVIRLSVPLGSLEWVTVHEFTPKMKPDEIPAPRSEDDSPLRLP